MGIWERLEHVVKSYLKDDADIWSGGNTYDRGGSKGRYGHTPEGYPSERRDDPDLDAAYEELDEFLGRGKKDAAGKPAGEGQEAGKGRENVRPVPPELRQDLDELGLGPAASFEECREAYKKLLKIHHPDRHAKHEGNLKKATEKTARVNAAYGRLEKWFRLQNGYGS